MAAGVVNKTVGDGNAGTMSAKFMSDTGVNTGNLSPAPTLIDSAGAEVLGTTTDAAYAGSGNPSIGAVLKGIYTKIAGIWATVATPGSKTVLQTTLYDASGAAIDFTVASPTFPLPLTPIAGASAAMTDTTDHALTGAAAPGAGKFNYITAIVVSNSHATVGTDVVIKDGAAGTVLMTIPAAPAYGGAVITLPTPLKQPTANTALYAANLTTGSSTKVSIVGFAQ